MRRIVALFTVVAAFALSACSPASQETPSPSASSPVAASSQPAVTASAETSPSATAAPVDDTLSYIAQAHGTKLTVLTEPDGAEALTVKASDVLTVPDQTPLVFLVKQIQGSWLELYLPVRPNGSTGWVKADQVTLSATHMKVEVNLADFELTVWDGTDKVFSTPIGLGRQQLPTPGGVYYIRELLQPPDPNGVYGPYAYGLSGYSPVLDEFAGGDAVIGIHGTDDPSSIGKAVSHGCIRLPNDAITTMVTEIGLPLGTPVFIDAE
ncbi:L,D-transpeptidase [Demequina soli]|uniref:L,D-transpeptidase n=1 Tax=Demequina soli TaxID=1638987 RepID=UPI0007846A94|nr:L,D-transpeptidase [Demequina soli]